MVRTISTLLCFLAGVAAAAAAELTGTVVDHVGRAPLAGVRVEILESGAATNTGPDGRFALHVNEEPATIVASCPGYRVFRDVLTAIPEAALEIALTPLVSFTDLVEVTATRAREGSDPATITNLPAERVQQAYWGQDPAILLAGAAPGFYAYNDSGNGIGYSYFTIRGFGQARSRVTLNGAPLNDAESGELFFIDLADFLSTAGDIQVQRGVFGLSGIGGAVDITTTPGAVTPSFTLHAGLGSYGTTRYAARYESGLINGAWLLAARYSKVTTDGYRDQSWVDMWNYYISLAHLGASSSVRLVLFGGPERTHLAYLGVPRNVLDGGLTGDAARDRRHNPLTFAGEIDQFTQPHVQLLHELEIAPDTLLSQVFYLFQGDGYYEQFKENRWLFEYNLPDVVLPDGTHVARSDLVRRRTVDERDVGWVPKLTHDAGAWRFTLGGEVRLHRAHHFGDVRWARAYPAEAPPNQRYYDYRVAKQTVSLLGTATWRAADRLSLTAGLQAARHRYAMSDDALRDVAFSRRFDFVLPRLGAVYTLAPGTDTYVNIARGMREPAFRTIYDPQDYYGARSDLAPEDVWDIEAGMSIRRATWRARANVFSMRFANEIVYAGALDDSGVPVYGNGARSWHRGVEVEGSISATTRFAVEAALTLSHNVFSTYSELWAPGVTVVYDGNRIAGYPDMLANLTMHGEAGAAAWSVTARHVGRFYLDNSEDNRRDPAQRLSPGYVPLVNPSFTVLDAALQAALPVRCRQLIGARRIALDLRLNNALATTYTAFGYVDAGAPQFIPAAGRNYYAGLTVAY